MSAKQLSLGFEFPARAIEKNLHLAGPEDIYAGATQSLLTALREDRRLERKPSGVDPRALGDYFSMWANTLPDGGLVVVGQENDGSFSGCSRLSQGSLNDLDRTGDIHCPDARFTSKPVPVRNTRGEQDFILLFRIYYRDDRVVETVRGDAFIRSGESKRKLSPEEVRELQADKRQIDYELERCNYVYPEDFDLDLVRQFTHSFLKSRDLMPNHLPDEQVLAMRHFGTITHGEFYPNTAGALLFSTFPGRHYPGCKIRFLRFEGEAEGTGERFNVIKDVPIEGPIPIQIAEAERIIDGQLRDFARLGQDNKFFVSPEYPKTAWYEALVNACVHRSYMLRNMNIFVKMFDDRLVIESPGGFPPGVTSENIYDCHHPRNPHLMNAMFYLRFVRCAREGTRRIRDSMEEMRLPSPEFQQTSRDFGQIVRVTLHNNIKQRKVWIDSDAATLIGETIFATLTQDERRAINYVAEFGSIGVSELQRLTSRTWTTAKRTLKHLEILGLLRHVKKKSLDRDPHARYVLRSKR
jgi:ATP-dependent DNA helicase RecG